MQGKGFSSQLILLQRNELYFLTRHKFSRLDAKKFLTKSVEREMKVKGTGSRCLLQECVKDKYYARFHHHSYHCCREMTFISRLDVNFLDSTQNIDKVSGV